MFKHLAAYFAVIAGLLALSFALIQVTELRTGQVRRWTERQVHSLQQRAGLTRGDMQPS